MSPVKVVNTYNYDAYGELIDSTGGVENKYLFAGEQFDEALGDYYLRQRYYDANAGRFTRRDTYEGQLGEPVTLHKYIYGNDNPVNLTDPSGLFSMGEISAANSIRDILAGIQFSSGNRLISATLQGGDYGSGDFFKDFLIDAGTAGGIIFFSWAVKYLVRTLSTAASGIDDVVRVYRVESEVNTRIIISEVGEVLIQGDGTLFLTFGQRANVEKALKARLLTYPGTPSQIKSFEVPKSYVDDIRARAVPERGSRNRAVRNRPIKVHPKQEGDYGLRSKEDIQQLQRVIIQGSGLIES